MVAAVATTSAMAGAGFMDGGYTGHGRRDEVAGPVHRGEYVFDAEATARIGVGNLEALSDGRIGMVGNTGVATGAGAATTGGPAQIVISAPISVQAQPGMSDAAARQQGEAMGEGLRQTIREVVNEEFSQGGSMWRR
jgi:phage-related minor tail protein